MIVIVGVICDGCGAMNLGGYNGGGNGWCNLRGRVLVQCGYRGAVDLG